jgi:hypothetical protein
MSYKNEDFYINAVDYIGNLSAQIYSEPSIHIPNVNEIEALEDLLEMLSENKDNEKFSIAKDFLKKYGV